MNFLATYILENITQEIPWWTPGGISYEIPGGIREETLEKVAVGIPEKNPEVIPDRASGRIPEDILDETSRYIFVEEGTPGGVLDEIPVDQRKSSWRDTTSHKSSHLEWFVSTHNTNSKF